MRRVFGILIAGSTLWTGLPSAAVGDDQLYVVEYQASRAALNSGDEAAVADHALRAWQSTEQLLGDDRLTAILAYNYGHLVLLSDPQSAHEAMSRAVALQQAGLGDLDDSELNLYAAYAAFRALEFDGDRAGRLRNALVAGGDAAGCGIPGLADWDRSGIPRGKPRSLYVNDYKDEYIGGLVVGLHVTDDLAITDVRVLAEEPEKVFSEYVAEGIEGRRLPVGTGPDCRGDLIKTFELHVDFNMVIL